MNHPPIAAFPFGAVPAILYGADSPHVWLYLHGKLGRKEEAESFAQLVCPSGSQVLSIDLPEHGERCSDKSFAPWDAVPELENLLTLAQSRWDHISLRATSLGAWFSLLAFAGGTALLAAVLFVPGLSQLFAVTPLGAAQIGQIAALAFAPTVLIQLFKALARR